MAARAAIGATLIAGHFGFAALVKAREREAPLWALMLATVWLDVVFVPLFLAHIETIERAPGTRGSYGAAIIHADFTHSLVGASLLSVAFGWALGKRWGRRTGVVLALVAFSHWLLDLIVHRHDMPLLPGGAASQPRFGFALWQWPWAAAALEALLVRRGCMVLLARGARGESHSRRHERAGRARRVAHPCRRRRSARARCERALRLTPDSTRAAAPALCRRGLRLN